MLISFSSFIKNRGYKAVHDQPAKRNLTYSVVAAINVDGFVAYNIFPGSMNASKLFYWTLFRLLPNCNPYPGNNSVIILDNVAFHRSEPFRLIVQYFGAKLMYLPPYSPHLNTVELLFNALKRKLQCYPELCHEDIHAIAHLLMQNEISNISWRSVCKKIGYQYHCSGL